MLRKFNWVASTAPHSSAKLSSPANVHLGTIDPYLAGYRDSSLMDDVLRRQRRVPHLRANSYTALAGHPVAEAPDEGKLKCGILLPPPQPAGGGAETAIRGDGDADRKPERGIGICRDERLCAGRQSEPQGASKPAGRVLGASSGKGNKSQLRVGPGGH